MVKYDKCFKRTPRCTKHKQDGTSERSPPSLAKSSVRTLGHNIVYVLVNSRKHRTLHGRVRAKKKCIFPEVATIDTEQRQSLAVQAKKSLRSCKPHRSKVKFRKTYVQSIQNTPTTTNTRITLKKCTRLILALFL